MSDVKIAAQHNGDGFTLWNGDCVEVTRGLPDNSVHTVVYSPPFESLYTFSDDPRDMSNCRDKDTFWAHYNFLIREYYRAMKPGRIAAVHCMQLPTSKTRDGFIGIRDFRGEVVRAHQDAGFIFHSEVMIRKDPVSAMQRSKSIGLLHKQLCKDSTISRMALADYVVVFRKPGDNAEPVSGPFDAYYGNEAEPDGALKNDSAYRGMTYDRPGDPWYSVAVWQRYAESVWMDIAQGDVLNRKGARDEPDEAHISPLQLTVIRRVLDLWSNPGDVVYSPFAGIGSELYVALQMSRKAIGAELKPSYYQQAVKNCEAALKTSTKSLFDRMDAAE
jgi:DNA modification methylase